MAGEKCSLTCNVKDSQGHIKVSALWEDLIKFFKGDRREAILHYFLSKDSYFLRENSDVLEFDVDGEVTIASLKKALERDGEYSDLSNARTLEHLNKEIKAGRYEYSEALDNVLKFNKSNQFRDNFMATLKKEADGKYSISVVERSPSTEYELANHVQNKILTDAIRLILKDKGLSVEFLDNPSYAVQYSTQNVHLDADGLMAIAKIMNGVHTSSEAAEAAGHFIVAAMQHSSLIQRLIAQLTPEVQTAIFKNQKSELMRDDFIVSEDSAKEAAGILVGKALISPFMEAQTSKASKFGAFLIKGIKNWAGIKFLLNKICNLVRKVFGKEKPEDVQKMVEKAKEMASTAAEGFITNPEEADEQIALMDSETYVGGSVTKRLSDDVRRNVKAYYETLGSLKDMVSRLRTSIGRAESPINKDILNKLKTLTKGIVSNYSSQMSMETFAKEASLAGMVVTLEGLTQILDNDIRTLLDQIQPSDRIQSYASISTNARNMRTVNTAIKNIAELYLVLSDKLDTINSDDKVQFPDADNNQVVTTLREAIKRLGDVLIGNDEVYVDTKGQEQHVNGIQKVLELKRKQLFIDAITNFYGSDSIERNAGKVWQQEGLKLKLINSGNTSVKVRNLIDSMDEDISWFDRYLSSAADCGDFVTAVGNKVTKNANMQADRIASRYWDKLEGLRLQMQDIFGTTDCRMLYEELINEDGSVVKTGNLVSHVNYGAWEKARSEFRKELKKGFRSYLSELRKKAYENNKNVAGFVWAPTDQQLGILYHNYVDPLWKKWHEENSEVDKTFPGSKRMIPNSIKYHNAQWDALFDTANPSLTAEEKAERNKRLRWYNALMEIKDEMDSLLPANSTLRWRAPQMTGRFYHRYKNLSSKMQNNRAAFGHAMRRSMQDWMVVRADEAYLFGSNNEFNEIEEDPLENPLFFEKEKVNRLPIFGVNKLKNMEDLSTDLFGTMLQYGSMAATYKAMEQVVDVFELGRDVLKQRKVGNKIESNRDSESKAYARYVKFIEKSIYGVNVEPPRWDKRGMFRKIANSLSSLGGRILLWGNLHGGLVNTGTGTFEILKEAFAGENFSTKDLNIANKMYFSGLVLGNKYGGGFWSTVGSGLANAQRPDDKNSLWIRHWNILSENRAFLHNQKYDNKASNVLNNRLWDWFGHTMMLPYSSGDHYMQTIPYYAMGNNTIVYDREGKAMKLIDAYEIVDGEEVFDIDKNGELLGRTPKKLKLKDGIFRSVADIDKYETVQGILDRIDNYFNNHPNAKNPTPIALDMFSNEERSYLKNEGFAVPNNVKQLDALKDALKLKSSELVYNTDDESAFMDKCRNICNRLHGIYNSEDKVTFQQHWYGNLVMAMRGYALGMANRRFSNSKFNVPQGKVIEGNYNTSFKVLASAFYDVYNMDNWKAVGEAFTLAAIPAFLFSKKYGERMKADMLKAGFSEHQYYNMRRTGADFLVIEALMLLKLLSSPGAHFGLNDEGDEEGNKGNDTSDNIIAGLIYYFTMRWDREQEAFNTPTGMWNEATSLLDYVPIGLSGSNNIWNIGKLFVLTQIDKIGEQDLSDSELYYQSSKEDKYEQGEEKWWVLFKRQLPYFRSWYTFTHPYDAASGYQYGRRVRNK